MGFQGIVTGVSYIMDADSQNEDPDRYLEILGPDIKKDLKQLMLLGFVSEYNDDKKVMREVLSTIDGIKSSSYKDMIKLYIKQAYGVSTERESEELYEECKRRLIRGIEIFSVCEESYRRIWSEECPDLDKVLRSNLEQAKEDLSLFLEQSNHKIACEIFVHRLHNGFNPPWRRDSSEVYWDAGLGEEMEQAWRDHYKSLPVLDWLFVNVSPIDEILSVINNEEEYEWVLKRNSEHKRKIAKPVKRKTQEVTKRHIFRKNVSG
jgi:hypothetical protein